MCLFFNFSMNSDQSKSKNYFEPARENMYWGCKGPGILASKRQQPQNGPTPNHGYRIAQLFSGWCYICRSNVSLEWRHNRREGVSNNQPHDCLLNRSFRRRSKKTSKLRVTGLCEGNSPVNSPNKGPVTRKSVYLMTSSCGIDVSHYRPSIAVLTSAIACTLKLYVLASSHCPHWCIDSSNPSCQQITTWYYPRPFSWMDEEFMIGICQKLYRYNRYNLDSWLMNSKIMVKLIPVTRLIVFLIQRSDKYSLLMHCIKIKSPVKFLLNEQYVFVDGNISFLCVLSCSSEEA